ncbi:MAG: Bug family tripartite tricarboxylate transporter substrate binding protein [Lautropia sp.]
MRRTAFLIAVAAGITFSLIGARASAQGSYPERPIRIVVPSTPGGGADFIARLLAQKLAETLKAQVAVENRPGGGQLIGTEVVARSAPDGYTLLMTYTDHVYAPFLRDSLPYDTVKDFKPISMLGSLSFLMAVNPAVPARTIQEFVALAKEKPGTLNFASAGNASSLHLSAELFNSAARISTIHVPYKGSAPAMSDLVSGRVQYIFASPVSLVGLIRDGKLRALAFGGAARDAALPDVPTFAESGFPGFEPGIWYAMLAPAGTPDAIITKLNSALRDALALPDVREKLRAQGVTISSSTPAELGAKIDAELARWGKIIRDAKIKL